MKRKWVAVVAIAMALFLFFVPIVPVSVTLPSNCVWCPNLSGINYSSITYALFGRGVYHTIWRTFGLSL
jgi:hypothetical protein